MPSYGPRKGGGRMAEGTRPARRPAFRAVAAIAILGGVLLNAYSGVASFCGLPPVARIPRCAAAVMSVMTQESGLQQSEFQETELQESELQGVFSAMDFDGDGAIDAQEFASALDAAGPPMNRLTMQERIDMFSAADVDHNGRMDYQEFVKWIRSTRDYVAIFKSADDDDDGQIDYMEWQRLVAALTVLPVARDELEDVFDQLDVDADGLVSFAEFARWMEQPRREGGLRGLFDWVKHIFSRRPEQ